jgi:hypothetical protein
MPCFRFTTTFPFAILLQLVDDVHRTDVVGHLNKVIFAVPKFVLTDGNIEWVPTTRTLQVDTGIGVYRRLMS